MLVFRAEDGDNIATLAVQLGVPVDAIKEAYPELGPQIVSGAEFKLDNLEQVQAINNTINSMEKDWNCANFCAHSVGVELPAQFAVGNEVSNIGEFEQVLENSSNFQQVSEGKSRIGSIIYYDYVDDPIVRNQAVQEQLTRLKGLSDKDLVNELWNDWGLKQEFAQTGETKGDLKYYVKNHKSRLLGDIMAGFREMQRIEKHFAIVVLKSKDGKHVKSVIQRRGTIYDGVTSPKTNTDNYYEVEAIYTDKTEEENEEDKE